MLHKGDPKDEKDEREWDYRQELICCNRAVNTILDLRQVLDLMCFVRTPVLSNHL